MGGLRGSFLGCIEGLLAVKATEEKDLENEREGFRVYFLSSIMSELRILAQVVCYNSTILLICKRDFKN